MERRPSREPKKINQNTFGKRFEICIQNLKSILKTFGEFAKFVCISSDLRDLTFYIQTCYSIPVKRKESKLMFIITTQHTNTVQTETSPVPTAPFTRL